MAQHCLQRIRRDRRIGGDEAEHGRHIGMDHARAFGDAGDSGGLARYAHLLGKRLGYDVGRHDRLRRIEPIGFAQMIHAPGQSGGDFFHWQRLHNHAGGKRQHLRRRTRDQGG